MVFSIAAVVRDTDGSAFITKAEFDSLKNNFQAQIDNYNSSIDSKIDGAIASYLAGLRLATVVPEYKFVSFSGGAPINRWRSATQVYFETACTGLNNMFTDMSLFTDTTYGSSLWQTPSGQAGGIDTIFWVPYTGTSLKTVGGSPDYGSHGYLFRAKTNDTGSWYNISTTDCPMIINTWVSWPARIMDFGGGVFMTVLCNKVTPTMNAVGLAHDEWLNLGQCPANTSGKPEKNYTHSFVNFKPVGFPSGTASLGAFDTKYLPNGSLVNLLNGDQTVGYTKIGLADDIYKIINYNGENINITDIYWYLSDTAKSTVDSTVINSFGPVLSGRKLYPCKPTNYFSIQDGSAKVFFWVDSANYDPKRSFRFIECTDGVKGAGLLVPLKMSENNGSVFWPTTVDCGANNHNPDYYLSTLGMDAENKKLFFDIPYTKTKTYYSLDIGTLDRIGITKDEAKTKASLEYMFIQEGLHCDIEIYDEDGNLYGTEHPF